MKVLLIYALLVIFLLLVSGCSTPSPATTSIREPVIMVNKEFSFVISINQLKIEQPTPKGSEVRGLNVYMTVKNTGKQALYLTCHSTITDYAGVSRHGIGVSPNLLYPGEESKSMRDILIIGSGKQYDALVSQGSKLDVECMGQQSIAKDWMFFDASWNVNPADFK